MNFDRLVEISRALKDEKQTGKQFHTTFAIRKNKILAISFNDYTKTHPLTINYVSRFGNTHTYTASQHSEQKIYGRIMKMGFNCNDLVFVNVRITNGNQLGLSAPCPNCFANFVGRYGYRRFYYSNEFGGFSELVDCNAEKYIMQNNIVNP